MKNQKRHINDLVLLSVLLVLSVALSAQTLSLTGNSSETFALIIGISDYQNEAIPDLKYADRDAKAFSDFLKTNSGGNLAPSNLKILINTDATTAKTNIKRWLLCNQ